MESGAGLTQGEVEALLGEAAEPAIAFLYDDQVRDALVAQVCDLTGCPPVYARLALWATQQAASGIAASGVQWLGGQAAVGIVAVLVRCPGSGRLVLGLRRLFRRAREEAAFRAELVAIANGERDPELAPLPKDAADDIRLALALLTKLDDVSTYLPGEFDALHDWMANLRAELVRIERIEALVAEALKAFKQQYEARIAGLEQQRQLDRDTIAAQNAALRALADRAERAEPTPHIELALAKAAQGDTRAAETLLAEIGSRKAQEHTRFADHAQKAAVEAAEAYHHQGALAQIRSVADAIQAYRRAAELDPDNCWTWIFLARLQAQTGDLISAEHAAAKAKAIAREERDLAAAVHELGELRRAQGDLVGALQAHSEGHRIFERLAAANPENVQRQRDLAVSWDKLGDVWRAQGQYVMAADAYSSSQRIAERLAMSDANNAHGWRDLSVSWEKLGSIRLAQQDLAGALHAFSTCKTIRERLTSAHPCNSGWQRDLAVSWNKLGSTFEMLGKPLKALRAYRKGKRIADHLASIDSFNLDWQRDLAVSCERLSNLWRDLGDYTAAMKFCDENLDIIRLLLKADSSSSELKRDLALNFNRRGQIQECQGDMAAALSSYDQSRIIHEQLAALDATNAQWQRDLVIWHCTRARLLDMMPTLGAEARTHWAEALRIARTLLASGQILPLDPNIVQEIDEHLTHNRA